MEGLNMPILYTEDHLTPDELMERGKLWGQAQLAARLWFGLISPPKLRIGWHGRPNRLLSYPHAALYHGTQLLTGFAQGLLVGGAYVC